VEGGHWQLTSSGAEATTQVVFAHYFQEARLEGKNQFIMRETFLEELSCVVKKPQEDLQAIITPRTALVSLEIADSLSGLLRPWEVISALMAQKKVPLHVDVTEAIGSMPISVQADYISFDASKLGIIGMGALWSKHPVRPLIYGQRTFNEGLVKELLNNVQKVLETVSSKSLETARLRKRFEQASESFGAYIIGKDLPRLPHKSYLAFDKIHPNALAFYLQEEGFNCVEGPEGVSFTIAEGFTGDIKQAVTFLQEVSQGL
ncbi:MAG: aminotransferase class V-fold PLP-dependent enzyme, partial [Chlamydiota bacterium]